LNDLERRNGRYIALFLLNLVNLCSNRADLCMADEFMHESIVYCSACTISSQRKFTFAILSPDEFLVNNNIDS